MPMHMPTASKRLSADQVGRAQLVSAKPQYYKSETFQQLSLVTHAQQPSGDLPFMAVAVLMGVSVEKPKC